jgi:hypothetical protein
MLVLPRNLPYKRRGSGEGEEEEESDGNVRRRIWNSE